MKVRSIRSRSSVQLDTLENRRLMAADPVALWTAPVDGSEPAILLTVAQKMIPFGDSLYVQQGLTRVWKTDGTPDGTKNIGGSNGSDNQGTLVGVAGGYLYFSVNAYSSIYHETVGSLMAVDSSGQMHSVTGVSLGAIGTSIIDGRVYAYSQSRAPTKYHYFAINGTTASSIESIPSGTPYGFPTSGNSITVGNAHFYAFDDVTHGDELWFDDGSGARMVEDLNPGSDSSNPASMFNVGESVLFTAYAPTRNTISVTIEDDVLKVTGTSSNDHIVLTLSGNNLRVRATNNLGYSFDQTNDVSAITGFLINGGLGHDNIDLRGVSIPATILGGNGNDTIASGTGDDMIDGGEGLDTLDYSQVTQNLTQAPGSHEMHIGNDHVDDHENVETILAGSGDDDIEIYAYVSSVRVIYGNGGNDKLSIAGDEQDHSIVPTLHGGTGNDTLTIDRELTPLPAVDAWYYGDEGDDTFSMSRVLTNRHFIGGSGTDTVDYRYFNNVGGIRVTLDDQTNDGPYGNDNVGSDVEIIQGTPDNDTLIGNEGNQKFFGNNGDDYIVGNGGHDTINGGSGNNAVIDGMPVAGNRLHGSDGSDLIQLMHNSDPTKVDVIVGAYRTTVPLSFFDFGLVIDGRGGDDRIDVRGFSFATSIYGHSGNDKIFGGDGKDRIYGGDGDDWISGGEGKDVIYGEAGNDRIFGGAGRDYIVGGAGVNVLRGEGDRDSIFAKKGDNFSGNKGDLISLLA